MPTREQNHAHSMISRFGGAAVLRRGAVDRPCTVGELEFNPRERELMLEGARRFLISAVGLSIPPDHEQDLLVAFGEVLRIVLPVKGPRPAGIPIFYDAIVVYQSAA